ncbi:MAG: type I methionyl aminopeptidase [Candidatus Pacebacteria bacterium]|nr:type I methionyl aminopeptidase [Candidatus Paceibacterota bacterium]
MISKKTPEEIAILQEAGAKLARILKELGRFSVPGVTTQDVDDKAIELAREYGVETVLLGYHPDFAPRPYPAAICASVNDTVQHGIPTVDEVLLEGDIINIDMSIAYKHMIVDSGITVPVGDISKEDQKLIDVTREARAVGIKAAQPGNRIGDISNAIESFVKPHGYGIVESLCGHGVGYAVHEEPNIPNYGKAGTGPVIEVGHVYAIEPIINQGTKDVVFDDDGDGYSIYTEDGKKSAHFEHTVAITENGPLILTKE